METMHTSSLVPVTSCFSVSTCSSGIPRFLAPSSWGWVSLCPEVLSSGGHRFVDSSDLSLVSSNLTLGLSACVVVWLPLNLLQRLCLSTEDDGSRRPFPAEPAEA